MDFLKILIGSDTSDQIARISYLEISFNDLDTYFSLDIVETRESNRKKKRTGFNFVSFQDNVMVPLDYTLQI